MWTVVSEFFTEIPATEAEGLLGERELRSLRMGTESPMTRRPFKADTRNTLFADAYISSLDPRSGTSAEQKRHRNLDEARKAFGWQFLVRAPATRGDSDCCAQCDIAIARGNQASGQAP